MSYLKTSQALALFGVLLAQLFRLHHNKNPDPILGFHAVGKRLAAICQGGAILILLLGVIRWRTYQHAMLRRKALSGGFEVTTVWVGLAGVSFSKQYFIRKDITD